MTTDDDTEARLDAFAAAGGFRHVGNRRARVARRPEPHGLLVHDLPLAADGTRTARLHLPADLTTGDAERIIGFVNALAVDGP